MAKSRRRTRRSGASPRALSQLRRRATGWITWRWSGRRPDRRAGTKHQPLGGRQNDQLRRISLDHIEREAALLVVHPDVAPGMERKEILPKTLRERIADDQHGRAFAPG